MSNILLLTLLVDAPPEFLARVREAVMADPQLPRPNPTVSQWQEPPHPTMATIQSASLPQYTDFAVIGSGITGCSVTKALLEYETFQTQETPPHVTVLEARTLVSGATGRNGGNLVTPAGHMFSKLVSQYGVENAMQMVRFSIMNVDRILEMVRHMDPELQEYSQIRDVRKVMVAGNQKIWNYIRESLEAFRKAVPQYQTYHQVVEGDEVLEVSIPNV